MIGAGEGVEGLHSGPGELELEVLGGERRRNCEQIFEVRGLLPSFT